MSTAPVDIACDGPADEGIITRSDVRAESGYVDDKNAIVRREIDRIARQLEGLTKSLKRVKETV